MISFIVLRKGIWFLARGRRRMRRLADKLWRQTVKSALWGVDVSVLLLLDMGGSDRLPTTIFTSKYSTLHRGKPDFTPTNYVSRLILSGLQFRTN
jgi:hypothetical protein